MKKRCFNQKFWHIINNQTNFVFFGYKYMLLNYYVFFNENNIIQKESLKYL